jgi:hypothetical protein
LILLRGLTTKPQRTRLKSAFSEGRLLGYDQTGRIVLSYRDSADGKLKSEALDPLELIRRWLLHVLPKGLVRVRHYGWLNPLYPNLPNNSRLWLKVRGCRQRPSNTVISRRARFSAASASDHRGVCRASKLSFHPLSSAKPLE